GLAASIPAPTPTPPAIPSDQTVVRVAAYENFGTPLPGVVYGIKNFRNSELDEHGEDIRFNLATDFGLAFGRCRLTMRRDDSGNITATLTDLYDFHYMEPVGGIRGIMPKQVAMNAAVAINNGALRLQQNGMLTNFWITVQIPISRRHPHE
ncbi:MAG: hypothetical protein FWF10_11375, partial [Clostridiales bacterium]|nr:hypothetical protein [Clostridiales bacterium]